MAYFMNRTIVMFFLGWMGLSGTVAVADTAGLAGYYIGRDGRATVTTGTFAGLANPNFGRLTFLLNHGDHYHGIGSYSHSGTASAPVISDTNTNNRIPEGFSLQPPLPLSQGTGPLYGDKWVTTPSDLEYSNLTVKGVDSLASAAPGSEAGILFNSSAGRWTSSLANSQVALQLVSISPGLFIGDQDTLNLFEAGDTYSLDDGALIDFAPVFWTAAGVAPGKYSAEFRLIDLASNGAGDSGRFYIDVAAVPLPAAVWLLGSALLGLVGIGRRRAS